MTWVILGVCILCGVVTVAATMLSSRMSNAGIVVRRGPEQGAPFDEYDCDGNLRKQVVTRNADAWREEYAAAMRLRDGVGRRTGNGDSRR